MTRALAWLLGALFVILPFAHVPALRNLLALIAALIVPLILLRERRPLPLAAWMMVAWTLLGGASAAWSGDPGATLHDVFYNMILPAGVFLAAWRAASDPFAFERLRWAVSTGILGLAGLVALVLVSGAPIAIFTTAGDGPGLARYWPGVGVASTLAALVFPFGLLAVVSARTTERSAGVAVIGAALAICVISQNRIVWPAILLAAAGFAGWLWPVTSARSRRLTLACACAAALAGGIAFHYAQRGHESDTQRLAQDPRLLAWREWGEIALRKPLFGQGLSRALLTQEGRRSISEDLRRQNQAFTWHAHNLLIDIAVQLGLVGLALYLGLLAALLREYWRLGGRGAPRAVRALGAAGFALLIAMLAKNSTDDFMDQAVAIAFWGYAGTLLGALERRSKAENA